MLLPNKKDQEIENLRLTVSKQKERLQADYETIKVLASGYDIVHLLNLETDEFTPYFVENSTDLEDPMIMLGQNDFYTTHRMFVENFCSPDYKDQLMKFCDKRYILEKLRGRRRYVLRVPLRRPDGSYAWTEFALLKFDDPGREATKIAIGYIDVDDLVNEERARMQELEAARMSEQNQAERYNFLVNVAHELRTPLTLILGPARRLMNAKDTSEAAHKSLSRIYHQADRMNVLLNTVLTTNKLEEGGDVARMEPVDFNKWIAGAAEEYTEEAESHGMSVSLAFDPSVGTVKIDEHLIKVVFANFMINSIHHNTPGTAIEVSTALGAKGKTVRLCVKDRGPGIGDVEVENLFKRYWRATEDKTGFGIGLSYSKSIIEEHGGSVGAFNNTDGQGATFWFEIPVDGTAAKAPKGPEGPLAGKTLLYVEDDKDLRDYMQTEMESVFGTVLTAANGRDGLEVMERQKADVIITDVMMPEMDGIEFCTRVKKDSRFKGVPVIILSARADAQSVRRGYEARADHYLEKPFDFDELVEIINEKLN